ncbi:hypothetical protein H0A61_00430 [Koleobacter methoxysyntrophicus]|uniref:Uncharacterized protein n=1 Tax=Koleobacter methoxysyntrophicus TaxID=2751313 RepID=A0A8A0RKE7_9FIRM|nr:hypothetical protein [Koleobacter methoxysyntrophicus]QSQ08110.1 hypothetical protein H0A61_00430 [Koleobacter methoxysyntrophicus]
MIVTFLMDDVYEKVAKKFAARKGFKYLRIKHEEEVSEIEEDFVFVLSPEKITEKLLDKCYKASCERNVFFGFITSLNDEIINRKLDNFEIESTLNFEKAMLILRKENKSIEHELNAYVLTRRGCTVDNIASFISEKLLLSVVMDGNRRHLHLNDGKICGINSAVDINEIYKYFPECENCEYKRIEAEKFNIECMFMNSCSSTLISTSEKGRYINVGMNILKNAKALISAYRPKEGYISEALLYYFLVNKGYKMGEILYILNMNSYHHGSDYFPFVLLGFPNTKILADNEKPNFDTKVTVEHNGINIDISELDYFIEVNIDLSKEPDKFEKILNRKYRVFAENVICDDIYYSIIPYKARKFLKVFVYSWKKINKELRIKIDLEDESKNDLVIISNKYKSMQKLEMLGFRHQKIKGKIRNYSMYAITIIESMDESFRNLKNSDFLKKLEKLKQMEKDLYTSLKDMLLSQNPRFFVEEYRNNVVTRCADSRFHEEHQCPFCGNPLSMKESYNGLLDIKRLSAFCSNCHNVFDVPFYGEKIKYPLIEIKNYSGDSIEFFIHVKNLNPYITNNCICFNVWCENRSEFENLILTKEFEIFELNPNSNKSIEVSVCLKDTTKKVNQTYCLYVYWFENFDIFVSTYTFKLKNI